MVDSFFVIYISSLLYNLYSIISTLLSKNKSIDSPPATLDYFYIFPRLKLLSLILASHF
jgi:hypothetical protein